MNLLLLCSVAGEKSRFLLAITWDCDEHVLFIDMLLAVIAHGQSIPAGSCLPGRGYNFSRGARM